MTELPPGVNAPLDPDAPIDREPPTRREMVALLAQLVALPSTGRFISAWLQGTPGQAHGAMPAGGETPPIRDYRPQFFDDEDFDALRAFTEILIPTDATPGAREARCADFIDFVLAASTDFAPGTQRQWRTAMAALREAGFHGADAAGRAELVAAIAAPERQRGAAHPAYFAYRLIKQQNTFAFYTSRAGSIEALEYKGNSYNAGFPPCDHPEHHTL